MKVGELRKIITDIDTVYDNCDVTCYESNGNLGYASIATTAYLGKTYVNQGYPIRRTFQIQVELPDKMKNININNMIKKYRKKPVTIGAIQWLGTNLSEIDDFVGESIANKGTTLVIHTLEGDMEASIGDYIIKGVKGEFYPCKPDIFAKTYEEVE